MKEGKGKEAMQPELGRLLKTVNDSYCALSNRLLAPFDLTLSQYGVLGVEGCVQILKGFLHGE